MRPVLLVACLVSAGCAAPAPGVSGGEEAPGSPAVVPGVDAGAVVRDLRAFVKEFPYRSAESPTHVGARVWILERLERAGLETSVQEFPVVLGPVAAYSGENLVALKRGVVADRWVVVATHYDTSEGSVEGAYDNGAGTVMALHMALAWANASANRSVAFVFFDQEDRGLRGSQYFVESILAGTFAPGAVVEAVVDLDMVGITHPHPAPLGVWTNDAGLEAATERARRRVGVPDDKVEFRAANGGTTHAAAFDRAGISQVSFFSNMDETWLPDGTKLQSAYPWWHAGDTWEAMVAMAGGEDTLRAGFQTVLDVALEVVEGEVAGRLPPEVGDSPEAARGSPSRPSAWRYS